MLLLLADMEEAEVVKSFLTSVSTFSQRSARLAGAAEKLPSQVREQTALLIQDIEEHQANLQQTLDKTKETAAALDHSLGEARTTIETLERTASAITTTAEQWRSAATATEAVVTSVRQWRDSTPKRAPGQSVTIQDYQRTILDVTAASNELQGLIISVHDLVQSEAFTARINDVQGRANALVDHVAWRLMQLFAVIGLLVLILRLVSTRRAHQVTK